MGGVLLAALVLALLTAPRPIVAKNVRVSLEATWPETSLLAEASEFIAGLGDGSLFWSFVEGVQDLEGLDELTTPPVEIYTAVQSVAQRVVGSQLLGALRLAMAMRYHSPRVEAYRSLTNATALLVEATGNRRYTTVDEVEAFVKSRDGCGGASPLLFDFDHIHPAHSKEDCTVIVYSRITDPDFARLHRLLRDSPVKYVFRHLPSPPSGRLLGVQGYGVSLMIKNMEYKTMDDKKVEATAGDDSPAEDTDDHPASAKHLAGIDFDVLKERRPELREKLVEFEEELKDESGEAALSHDVDLAMWEVQNLGHQASYRILKSASPLATMVEIAQNFPRHASELSKISNAGVKRVAKALAKRRHTLPPGQSALFVAGRALKIETLSPTTLVETITAEVEMQAKVHTALLHGVGHTVGDSQVRLLTRELLKTGATPTASGRTRRRVRIDLTNAHFMNDVETDKSTARWPRDVKMITTAGRRGFPRRNMFTAVFLVDPGMKSGLAPLLLASRVLYHASPIRFAIIFVDPAMGDPKAPMESTVDPDGRVQQTVSVQQAVYCAFSELEATSPMSGFTFLTYLYSYSDKDHITTELAENIYQQTAAGGKSWEDAIQSDACVSRLRNSSLFAMQSGVFKTPMVGTLNGVVLDEHPESVIDAFEEEAKFMKEAVEEKRLTNSVKDIYEWVLAGAPGKHQPAITARPAFLKGDVAGLMDLLEEQTWLYPSSHSPSDDCNVTMLVKVDLDTAAGRQHAMNAVQYLRQASSARLGFVLTAANSATGNFAGRVQQTAGLPPAERIAEVLRVLENLPDGKGEPVEATPAQVSFAATLPAASVVVVNGRVVRLDPTDQRVPSFTLEDWTTLIEHELQERGMVAERLSTVDWLREAGHLANRLFVVTSLVGQASLATTAGRDLLEVPEPITNTTCPAPCRHGYHVPSISGAHDLEVVAVLDPLSKETQKVGAMLQALHSVLPVDISVYLNPVPSLRDVPLKTFYRYVMAPQLSFDPDGMVATPAAFLTRLPESQVLTLGIDEPEAWIVTAKYSPYDLDNIKLQDISGKTLSAKFELLTILVTGACEDVHTEEPPRGLPLQMRELGGGAMQDTLVMSNRGYFQLKGAPGIWTLNIQEGRGSRIFSILDATLIDEKSYAHEPIPNAQVVVNSYDGCFIYLKVTRNAGYEEAQLLSKDTDAPSDEDPPAEPSFLAKITGAVLGAGKPTEERAPAGRATLNIFSLASGHLYERFLKIMVHTVMLHSNHSGARIKFWFVNNFLSPKFKKTIDAMSQKWGFEYGLVTYKWPLWLRRQTEKQRIIWGYKVLFLDVLFPLDVEKIIYVDADQIVRADLHELYNLDLKGRAVGYTPFCREHMNPETKGFRFWDGGYWKDHLKGLPYHISAIYVVDLARFRRAAAGDNYRMIYDTLSADPNSLANLDQDLPNYSQHLVPIFSLPEHWLWCETWCSQESKGAAKTIDLCNNPLTKSPKLENAKRIIPEWTSYDKLIEDFERSVDLT